MQLRLTALVVCLGAFLGGWIGLRFAGPDRVTGLFPLDPATPYIRFVPRFPPIATAILIHGLNSNKEFMQTFAMALADAGLETYAIDLPGHGDSSVPFTYTESLRVVEGLLDFLGSNPVVIGHSMGGAILTELALTRQFETMLLLSPAPVPLENLRSDRLLVVTGALEAPPIHEFVPQLIAAAGPGAESWEFPDATHSTALFDPPKLRRLVEWLGGQVESVRTWERYVWLALMTLAGTAAALVLIWPSKETVPRPRQPVSDVRPTLVWYIAASGGALLVLRSVNPLEWLGIFATDYPIGLLLIVGLLLWAGHARVFHQWPTRPATTREKSGLDFTFTLRGVTISLAAAIYVIGVLLVGVGSHLIHLVPSGVQWLWFPVLTAAAFPLFLYDEQNFRPIPSWWRRWGAVIVTRVILWAAVVTGVLLLNTADSFLVLIMHLVVLFWLVLWGVSGFVARATGEPAPTALFAALVHGWALAAIFVRV